MRPVLWNKRIFLMLLAAACSSFGARAAGTPPAPSKYPSWVEPGHGRNEAEAILNARDNARDAVVKYLNDKYGAMPWMPDAAFLDREGVVQLSKATEANTGGLEKDFEVDAKINLTPTVLELMQVEVRKVEKAQQDAVVFQREILVGRFLAALVALFLVIAGYLRLEDLTRGYYTTLLRAGAGAVLALTVALVVFLRF